MQLEFHDIDRKDAPEDMELPPGRCVFCGKLVTHINDGGEAWTASAVIAGEVKLFFYCNTKECWNQRSAADREADWTCGWCSVDNLSDVCVECRQPRYKCERRLLFVDWPRGDEDGEISTYINNRVAAGSTPVDLHVAVKLNDAVLLTLPKNQKRVTKLDVSKLIAEALVSRLQAMATVSPEWLEEAIEILRFDPQ